MLSLSVLNYCCMCKEAGGGGGARDTESKTRTPHKDVGKNHGFYRGCLILGGWDEIRQILEAPIS